MNDLLLDTCAFIWIAVSPERLSKSALRRIEQAPVLYASAVSAWEIAFKWRTGKLELPISPEEFVGRVKGEYGIIMLPVEEEAMLKAAGLPLIHRDPADRFIISISTALLRSFDVVTSDRRFAQYGVNTLI